MLRWVLIRLAALVACTVVWIAPAIAHAASTAACEPHDESTVGVCHENATAESAAQTCSIVRQDHEATRDTDRSDGPDKSDRNDKNDIKVAPMCDVRGASIVAPPRVLPIVDSRLEAAPSDNPDTSGIAVALRAGGGPSHRAGSLVSVADPIVLPCSEVVTFGCDETLLTPFYETGGPRVGSHRSIERPPR